MAEHQKTGQPAWDQDKSQADQWPSYTPQAETDNEFPEDPAASQPPSFTPQARTDNEPSDEDEDQAKAQKRAGEPSAEPAIPPPPGTNPVNPGRSGGMGQGRTDFGGEGRIPQ